ncbi:NhaP-type Na+/H+ or K+/H+ antiporter [Geosmithia morbida]|uniref:NhaP-type Na+/H+ or K+/H+ antiporter n=1 Tax=Geosmithia morbida TaxID=1094350 RepID=A0A9P5CXX9_9HYPO|nr:NhaP-type Na+/H+ or K+/H+ antiporter [Geosmithia morbida]KAF4119778.1 NhaP-type Na+/H+ or K+/H+ antiporter [Geosmithia morbida]
MAWSQLDVTKPHLVYIILGGFTSLFMLCSSVIKERMYIGEATVATLCGVIFGPYGANLIDPTSWGSTDIVTIEFSRIVLVVQCFAVGVELPRYYMERHWRSVAFLLIPVMMFGWLIVSLFVWWMIPGFSWVDGLVVAACITATDPVLASSVVGKGKFSKRVPKHLRDLLSAESGCNDGMAFPFIYLSLYLIQYNNKAGPITLHFVCYVILYECIFGAVFGFLVGYIARHGIRFAERHELIDRESFLVFYFVVALFCAGAGSILGVDDLLVGFAAGVGFSNDGWFGEKTEESHVSNVIDLLLNLTYFVYLGTIIPWDQYNNGVEGLRVWRLVVIAILVIFFRRIPIMLALKPLIPDLKTWREALFAGHFGPIGVGAIFVAIMARAQLEHEEPVPLAVLPSPDAEHYHTLYLVWPIVTFIVISSILVHGSSVAVFTLGKRINTLSLTMSYTQGLEDGPTWMNRLPRISSISRSQAKTSDSSFDKGLTYPPGTLAPPGGLLRRRKDEDGGRVGSRASSLVSRRRRSRRSGNEDFGGPISQSAIYPNRDHETSLPYGEETKDEEDGSGRKEEGVDGNDAVAGTPSPQDDDTAKPGEEPGEDSPEDEGTSRGRRRSMDPVTLYDEGDNMVIENRDGEVIEVVPAAHAKHGEGELPQPVTAGKSDQASRSRWPFGEFRRKVSDMYSSEMEKRKGKGSASRKHEPARAYQFGTTIIVEDEDGEVVKTYELPTQRQEGQASGGGLSTGLKYVGLGGKHQQQAGAPGGGEAAAASTEATTAEAAGSESPKEQQGESGSSGAGEPPASKPVQRTATGWANWLAGGSRAAGDGQDDCPADDDDDKIRFTIANQGRRMTKTDFINEMQKLDATTRRQVVAEQMKNGSPKARDAASVAVAKTEKDQQLSSQQQLTPQVVTEKPSSENVGSSSSSSYTGAAAAGTSTAGTTATSKQQSATPSTQTGETAAERRRRLAVMAEQGDGEDDNDETPAERRRREAALGMGGAAAESDDDDDDDEGDRNPSGLRIRFAEPARGRK